jgi:hypothetical protein
MTVAILTLGPSGDVLQVETFPFVSLCPRLFLGGKVYEPLTQSVTLQQW